MADLLTRTAVKTYADTYWFVPCADGQVWLSNVPINIALEHKKRKLDPADWTAVFLEYDARWVDGLFFIRKSHVAKLKSYKYHASHIPAGDKEIISPWEGLNDCSHFVSECLKAGGVGVYELGVANLVERLRARSDTKTLANFVDVPTAERIIDSGLMKVGDIVAFGTAAGSYHPHAHATVFMGRSSVANHSRFNHPDFNGVGGSIDNWKHYAAPAAGHPRVTLIHFGHDDPPAAGSSWAFGWWQMTWRAKPYFYYFDTSGRVGYTTKKPANLKLGPFVPDGKGYWFAAGNRLSICWTQTGSLEVLDRTPKLDTVTGWWNQAEPLVGVRLT